MNRKDSEDLVRVGPGTVMGELMRQYWIPAAMSSELKARRRADAADAARRAADRVPRQLGPGRGHGPPLPASLRLAVPRAQRGERHPLRLSRLEIRRGRQLRRHAEPRRRPGLQEPHQGQGLQGRRSATASSGSIWASAQEAPPLPQIEATLLPESEVHDLVRAARMQLAAGAGRRHRHLAFRLSARRRDRPGRSCRTTACSATR